MPTFLSLSMELQLLIISYTHLNHIENFASCSKLVRQLCKKRLMEQYARKRHFSTIAIGHVDNIGWDEDVQMRGIHPMLILRDLLADRHSRLYTKTLIIGCIQQPDGQFFYDQEEAELDEVEFQDVVSWFNSNKRLSKKVIQAQQRLFPKRGGTGLRKGAEAKRWTKEILSGDMEAAAILLIAILPNLQKIRFVDRFRCPGDSKVFTALRALLCAAVDDKHDLRGINSFNKLTEVGLHGLGEPGDANCSIISDFMMLPSLRTMKGHLVDGSSGPGSLTRPSNVTNLEFHSSTIEAAVFSNMLCRINGLKSFTYDFWCYASDEEHDWQPRQIIEALELYASKTLGHLEITGLQGIESHVVNINFKKGEPFIDSLRGFQVLRTIRLETMMLYKEVEGAIYGLEDRDIKEKKDSKDAEEKWARGPNTLVEPQRLVDILPISSRRLRLVGGLSNEEATAMLEDLPALKDAYLPSLSSIFFEDIEQSAIDDNVVGECEDSGVKTKFWRPSA